MASLLMRIEHRADPNSLERRSYRDNDVEAAVTQHLARMLKDSGGIPAHGNQRPEWDAGVHSDYPDSGRR